MIGAKKDISSSKQQFFYEGQDAKDNVDATVVDKDASASVTWSYIMCYLYVLSIFD